MFEATDSLLPILSHESEPHVICVGFADDSLDELEQLLRTLGVKVATRIHISSKRVNPATFIGQGKIQEVKKRIEDFKCEDQAEPKSVLQHSVLAVILDVELSPNQMKNLEKECGLPILDRPGIIIEIFSRHAKTKEAKTQVALARLQYLLPRLTHFWTHFERQRGGSTGSRGMGEKQFEVDRRLVKQRIAILSERLKGIERERNVQRAGRQDVLKVALVGYTNAGKSTLLNALTQSMVRAENKLFATLDASVRSLDPNSQPPVVAIDTVGFISKLPPTLVASFRSTLEELKQADLLVHVVDASHAKAREQYKVTQVVLEELGLKDKPTLIVLNKVDLVQEGVQRNLLRIIAPGAIWVSALNPVEVSKLRAHILSHFLKEMELWEILIPYSESKLESQLYRYGSIELNRHLEKGTFYKLRIEKGWAQKLGLEKYRI